MTAATDDVVHIGNLQLRFLVDETTGLGNLVMFEFTVPPAARVPAPHHHRDVDEVIYVLEGTVTTTLDGQQHELTGGQSLFVPRGSVHIHENLHPAMTRSLIVMTPGTIGRRYFEEVAQAINVPGKPDLVRVKEIMLKHGLVPA